LNDKVADDGFISADVSDADCTVHFQRTTYKNVLTGVTIGTQPSVAVRSLSQHWWILSGRHGAVITVWLNGSVDLGEGQYGGAVENH
jgi:hypothetical protein